MELSQNNGQGPGYIYWLRERIDLPYSDWIRSTGGEIVSLGSRFSRVVTVRFEHEEDAVAFKLRYE